MVSVRVPPLPPSARFAFGIRAGFEELAVTSRLAEGVSGSETPTEKASATSSLIARLRIVWMAGGELTLVVITAVLLLVPGSGGVVAATVARSVMRPAVGQLTTIEAEALAPEASAPKLKVMTFPLLVLVPWVELAERKVTVDGSVFVKATAEAVAGP